MKTPSMPLCSLSVSERHGVARINEPVTVGIPFPQGRIFDPFCLLLLTSLGQPTPLQVEVLARWADKSIKWALLDFRACLEANGRTVYKLRHLPEPIRVSPAQSLVVQESAEAIVVNTGQATFVLNRHVCRPFERVVVQDVDFITADRSCLILIDEEGREHEPRIQNVALETTGQLRATLKAQGEFCCPIRSAGVHFVARLSFYVGSSLVKMQITLLNPRSTRHPGGLWDLGDKGSLYFKDLSLHVALQTAQVPRIAWTPQISQCVGKYETPSLKIYQDSSGGENWQSTNHVNRFGKVMHTFRGYHVTTDNRLLQQGNRATPIITLGDGEKDIWAAIERFWQNFPKALEVHGKQLALRLFPQQYNDLFELQGGEQKTHTVYLQFFGHRKEPVDLRWVHAQLIPVTTPEWHATSKACSYLTPREQDKSAECLELIDTAIEGSRSFFARREIIDEYGWRHFGDLYADHEAAKHTGQSPLVAHYNNQYDVIYGAIVQYFRSGDLRWFALMRDLARHVIDIDIYHTQEDRPAYNGGLFWHTDHYLDAATATHRAYSKANLRNDSSHHYGGGPANEHNYTTGLLHYYFLTGDETAREAVLGLADWVISMDDGSQRFGGYFDRRPTGFCSSTAGRGYHGPGRGAGNSINALLDAYILTQEEHYLAKAEQIIRRCIHPADNIRERHLDDVEHRWSYTVFLQVLGKYLDLKFDKGDMDYMYGYAQASLLHYAEWMLTHEVPYMTVLDRVEIPTETWPAQDIRKCVVFHLASKHAAEPLRSAFRQRAEFFFQTCIRDLRAWRTCTLTRPIALLMTNAYVHAYFQLHPEETAPPPCKQYDFGLPRRFTPQLYELYWIRDKLRREGDALKAAVRHLGALFRRGQSLLGAHSGQRSPS
jgi:hypothetical protein